MPTAPVLPPSITSALPTARTTKTPDRGPLPTGGVVVGVDDSASAVHTAVWGARHAVQQGVPLTIVHCAGIASNHPLGELMGIAGRVTALLPDVHARFEVRTGDPVEVLTEMSRRAAMIVVGTAGGDAFEPDGSVPVRLVARSQAPVAVVAGGGRVHGPVLVGVDGSPRSLAALEFAAHEARRSEVGLIVLMAWVEVVLDESSGGLQMVQNWTVESSRWERELTRLLTGLRARFPDLEVTGELVHHRAAGALVDRAADCSEVVIGRRGSGRIHSLAAGSTSRALLAAAAGVVVVLPDTAHLTG
ncbi:universal stress protein [Nakamurella sp. A5-74]|uniref:Universal stress protein n=1 Tax=Nakamurella sp. A5-74 TaxID=3158264 RepID=A0AAU8DWW5_9ACTN